MAKADEVARAAVLLFARQGYAATGIRELGREVGLTSASLYHYAGGKEELLTAIMRACLDELLRAAREAVRPADRPSVQLGRLIRAHVGFTAVNPLAARVTDQEVRSLSQGTRPVIVGLRDEYEALVGQVIAAGVRTGEFRLADEQLGRLALLEMCNGVANWFRPDGRLTVTDVQNRYVELGGRVVGADGVSPSELGAQDPPVRLACEPPPTHPRS